MIANCSAHRQNVNYKIDGAISPDETFWLLMLNVGVVRPMELLLVCSATGLEWLSYMIL